MLVLFRKYLLLPQPQFHLFGLSVQYHPLVREFQVVPIFLKYHKNRCRKRRRWRRKKVTWIFVNGLCGISIKYKCYLACKQRGSQQHTFFELIFTLLFYCVSIKVKRKKIWLDYSVKRFSMSFYRIFWKYAMHFVVKAFLIYIVMVSSCAEFYINFQHKALKKSKAFWT